MMPAISCESFIYIGTPLIPKLTVASVFKRAKMDTSSKKNLMRRGLIQYIVRSILHLQYQHSVLNDGFEPLSSATRE